MMVKHHDIEINTLHTLENFRDVYDDEHSVVVLEAMANAIDAKADLVDITLKNNSITFRDNGPGMTRKQFFMYHKISGSDKTKGRGIGFAGVGAKIYLAIWKNTTIHTETYGDDGALESKMFVRHGKLKWDECNAATVSRVRGTSYGVTLRENDYNKLQVKLKDIIMDHFNFAMLNGLTIRVNNEKLEPWNPPYVFKIDGIIKVKSTIFPVTLKVMKEDISYKYRYVQYQVWGKTIITKKLDWAQDIKEEYRNRIHVTVNAEKHSKYLKLNKNSFKSGQTSISDMYANIGKWMYYTLKKNKYIEKQVGEVHENSKTSKFFQELFKNEEFSWLNPHATGGMGSSGGKNAPRKQVEKSPAIPKTNNKSDHKRSRSGIKIAFTLKPGDSRDGWMDVESDAFIYNTGHPLYRVYDQNEQARNQRAKSVIFSSLIKHANSKKPIPLEKAFNLHTKLMTYAKNLKVVK